MAAIEYEIFKDLLDVILELTAIAVAVVAGLAYVIYKSLNGKLKENAASAAKTEMYKALVLYHISCGLDYWRDYKNADHLFSMDEVSEDALNANELPKELTEKFKDKKNPLLGGTTIMTEKKDVTEKKDAEWVITNKNRENIFVVKKEERKPQIYIYNIYKRDIRKVNQAIETTELGYERYVKKLEKQKQEREWLEQIQAGDLICQIKNNLAYYYAERHRFGKAEPNDAADALKFADYVNTNRHNYPRYYSSYGRTHKFVYEQFSPTIDK
ncbi:hypothetical protein C5S53_08340 [Methanophagales archaeon]|nr:hypothetical protein C5S53_08340 [Methanophagales archaeon]